MLLLDDDPLLSEFLTVSLQHRGLTVLTESSPSDALERLATEPFDIVLSDLNLEGLDGLAFVEKVVERHADLPVILITGAATMEVALAAMRAGAWDLLLKPIDLKRLALSMDRARRHRALHGEVQRLRRLVPTLESGRMIGTSTPMRRLFDLIDRVAPGDAPVLVTGESGTGKELVASAIHAASARQSGPFVAVNCAAVPASLLESELFGHVKGAFTDAKRDRRGLFAQADGGTLFLDEIGDLPLEMQPKLLRAIQEHRLRPLGGTSEVAFDARLITATNRDLDTEVREKRFRQDLFYRINVVRIEVPPLRDRLGDILLLAQHFVDQAAIRSPRQVKGFAPAAAERLLAYQWPGNVRELENCVTSAVALCRSALLTIDDLPGALGQSVSQRVVVTADGPDDLITLEALTHRYLNRVLALLSGNKTRAAEVLGVDRRTLYRMLARENANP